LSEIICNTSPLQYLHQSGALHALPEKALAELEIAKAAWLKTARKAGKPVPKPRY